MTQKHYFLYLYLDSLHTWRKQRKISLFMNIISNMYLLFFEKNKVLGVEPNRALNILEGI
jgi:hypothetical protein